eukprot:COSAG04_NODE_2578_length_3902_cov_3.615830_5_plen_66_part_00
MVAELSLEVDVGAGTSVEDIVPHGGVGGQRLKEGRHLLPVHTLPTTNSQKKAGTLQKMSLETCGC